MANLISIEIEKTLKELNLGESDLLSKDLNSLQSSLKYINTLLIEPGKIFLERNFASIDADGLVTYHPLVYPLLLNRKQKILDRIEILKRESTYDHIETILNSGDSTKSIAEEVKKSIGVLREDDRSKLSENLVDNRQLEQLYKAKAEHFERKANSIRSFLEKGAITSILGFILLISLTTVEIIVMFNNGEYRYKEKIDTVFLILFGYYFGSREFKKNK